MCPVLRILNTVKDFRGSYICSKVL